MRVASILAKGKSFIAGDFSQELARLSNNLKAENSLNKKLESTSDLLTIRIIGSNDHENYLLKVRDEAKKRIFVCSH